jgi:hypothetical protein
VIVSRWIVLLLGAAGALALAGGCTPIGPATSGGRDFGKPAGGAAKSVAPTLAWKAISPDQTTARVELFGVDPIALAVLGNPAVAREEWSSFLAVRIVPENQAALRAEPPALLGSYTATREGIRFEPRFPLEPGLRFRAEFDPVQMHAVAQKHLLLCGSSCADWKTTFTSKLAADFSPPRRTPGARSSVVEIFPTADLLPENVLRFYIHFSAPMSRGEAYARIHLLDATGRTVSDPFLELAEELWSTDGTRFTLLIDPGRIKRGLKPREELGPVLEAGKAYTLCIDREWLDAKGNPLAAGFRKSFRAGPPDEISPDPKTWTIKPPKAETRTALEVRFPEALDRALLDRLIAVTDGAGQVARGTVTTSDGETVWKFAPHCIWHSGVYGLKIVTDLEDVAGNSVARPFEVDATGPVTRRIASESVTLPFRVDLPAR